MRQRLHPVERKDELGILRLLEPECAVIVESGDALGRLHIVRAALLRHAGDKLYNGLLAGPSFHEGSGSDCADAAVGRSRPNATASAASDAIKPRRLILVAGTEVLACEVAGTRHFPDMGFMVSTPTP